MNAKRLLNKKFPIIIYFFYLTILLVILYQLRSCYLLPMPVDGTDQRAILSVAARLSQGEMWTEKYLYSPIYTVFLSMLVLISRGQIVIVRILQAVVCAFIPVMIYRTGRNLGLKFLSSQFASFAYCFYAASALISLDFLRAAPLSLVFILYVYSLIRGYRSKTLFYYVLAGVLAASCVFGRENFIPVIFLPLFLLVFKLVRKRISIKFIFIFLLSALVPIFVVSSLNLIYFGCFAILPGNARNVLSFYYPGQELSIFNLGLISSIASKCIANLCNFISSYEIPNSLSIYAHKDFSEMLSLLFIPFNAILIPALFMPFLRRDKASLLCAILAVGYIISMMIFETFYRFRIPLCPLLCVMFGATIQEILLAPQRKRIIISILLLILITLTYTNPQPRRPIGEKFSTVEILIKEGSTIRAEKRIHELERQGVDVSILKKLLAEHSTECAD